MIVHRVVFGGATAGARLRTICGDAIAVTRAHYISCLARVTPQQFSIVNSASFATPNALQDVLTLSNSKKYFYYRKLKQMSFTKRVSSKTFTHTKNAKRFRDLLLL